MALVIPRFSYVNLIRATATLLSASSALVGNPVAWLKDQLRSKTWRSKLGWTIDTSFNDRIDFNRGGVKVATITANTYATGADLCTFIVAALEAADATPVWACTYSTSTFKYTISSDLAFTLLFGSGANLTRSVAVDIGFAIADTGSAVSQTAGSASYQSRHWVKANLVTAQAVTAGIVIGHNAGTGGTYTLQGNATDAWTAPTVNQALSGDASIRIAFISTQTLQYWRLLISDVQNTAGYAEVGVWFTGDYYQPPGYSTEFKRTFVDLSQESLGTHGALWQDERPQQGAWVPEWLNQAPADKLLFEALQAAMPRGRAFFFTFDTADPTGTKYVRRPSEIGFEHVQTAAGSVWNIAMDLLEALG